MREPLDWFRVRRQCADAFASTLAELRMREGVEEQDFVRLWMERVASNGKISRGGWYSPPPLGAALLSGHPPRFDRLRFSSLRDPAYFPGRAVIDWERGALFAYCSNVDLMSGIPGDFSLTIYSGDDSRIVDHFKNSIAAARQIVDLARRTRSSRKLFVEATEVLADFGLRNVIQSRTDAAVLDLGHSLEACGQVTSNSDGTLSASTSEEISLSRQFINADTDWDLGSVPVFTIEPQLLSTCDHSLPKVSLHYALARVGDSVFVDDPLHAMVALERRYSS